MKKFKKICVGIDESYTRTGITVSADGKIKRAKSIDFKGLKTKTEKRNAVREELKKILNANLKKADEVVVIVERMRSFSSNNTHSGSVMYIKATAGLIACIVDVCFDYGVKVYSVDTNSWKRQIVGTTEQMENKYKVNPKKWPTIIYVEKILKVPVHFKNKRGNLKFDDDKADSVCISLYGFLPGKYRKLRLEE